MRGALNGDEWPRGGAAAALSPSPRLNQCLLSPTLNRFTTSHFNSRSDLSELNSLPMHLPSNRPTEPIVVGGGEEAGDIQDLAAGRAGVESS